MQDDRAVPSHDRVEWISFEARMLRRRLSRCLLRVDLALEDGFRDDARSALEEARAIDPSSSDIASFEARLAELETPAAAVAGPGLDERQSGSESDDTLPPRVPRKRPSSGRWSIALAASVLAALGTAGAWRFGPDWITFPAASPARTTATVPLAQNSASQEPPAQVPPPKRPAPRNLEIVRDTVVARPAAPRFLHELATPGPFLSAEGPATPGVQEVPAGQTSQLTAEPGYPPAPLTEPRADRSDVVAALNVRTPETEAPPLTERLPRADVEPSPGLSPVAVVPPPVPLSTTEPPGTRSDRAVPTMPKVDELSGVRNVLARYEGAYSALDAHAASEVWPTVNRGALARAFHGLAAQQVSLGACDVTVSGPAARATCHGTASWKPKIGGGQRTEERHWEFQLRKADAGWIIERASTR